MKTDAARNTWDFWKLTRDDEFINWFENEIYGEETLDKESLKETAGDAFNKSLR